jgi:hypothetical protein
MGQISGASYTGLFGAKTVDSVRVTRQKNMVKGPAGPETKNERAGKGQQQFT